MPGRIGEIRIESMYAVEVNGVTPAEWLTALRAADLGGWADLTARPSGVAADRPLVELRWRPRAPGLPGRAPAHRQWMRYARGMRIQQRWARAWAAGAAALAATGATMLAFAAAGGADRVRWDFDRAGDLAAAGWTRVSIHADKTSRARIEAGALSIDSLDSEIWRLPYGPRDAARFGGPAAASPWTERVDPERGWAVEAHLRLDATTRTKCKEGGVFVMADDGLRQAALLSRPGNVALQLRSALGFVVERPFATTDGFHTYRLESRGAWAGRALTGAR